ncbi:MAG: DUF4423 domain-containing protein [Oligoflexia bacterium]|nr:DUF4423 domain-containing protein [Oligoflexia bacterium]
MEWPQHNNYRKILQDEFEQRCQRNPSYSLRAFSRDIKLPAPRLSEILRGKQGLSIKAAENIANRIGFSITLKSFFCDLVESEHSRSQLKRKIALARLKKYQHMQLNMLDHDRFKIISEWYHFAILELTYLDELQRKLTPTMIAHYLSIHPKVAEAALKRLVTVGLLEVSTEGQMIAKEDFTGVNKGASFELRKKYHQQILEKALEALSFQRQEDMSLSSITLAFKKENLAEAKAVIKKFRRDFLEKFGHSSESKDSVYNIVVQLFKLTKDL